MATCRSTAGHFLIRLVQNRAVGVPLESLDETPDDETQRDLMDEARRVPVTTTKELEIGSRGGRPSRVARLALGSVRVTVRPPKGEPRWRAEAPLTVTVCGCGSRTRRPGWTRWSGFWERI